MSTHKQRSHSKEQFWRRIVRQQRSSGLSVREFCEQHRLSVPSLYAWRRIFAQRERTSTATRPAFLPVQLTTEPTTSSGTPPDSAGEGSGTLELILSSGRRLRIGVGFDGPTLQRLLTLLEGRRCC